MFEKIEGDSTNEKKVEKNGTRLKKVQGCVDFSMARK